MNKDTANLSTEERQRRTATELLRRKVVQAYGGVKQKVIRTGNGSAVGRNGTIIGHESGQVYTSLPQQRRGMTMTGQNISTQNSGQSVAFTPVKNESNNYAAGQTNLQNSGTINNAQNIKNTPPAQNPTTMNQPQTATSTPMQHTATTPGAIDSVNPHQPNYANTSSFKQAPIQTTPSKDDWQKYHTAWQNYYQQYYSEYYAKAARRYIETEQMKVERAQGDDENLLGAAMTEANMEGIDRDQAELSLRERIRRKATDQARKTRRHRKFMPVVAGVAVVLVVLFLQFNRLIFAPIMAYVSPGNMEGDEITAVDPSTTRTVSAEPKLIIPKLNVEVPVHFGISNDNNTVMSAMNDGVAQFSISGADAMPGQNGNLVITGHSAGDIYSNNQYKFIFSGLERLSEGDKIYINYESKQYTYAVTRLKTIEPTDLAALRETTGRPQLILVTCTPLGTSQYRLLVYADQVSPAYEGEESSGSESGGGSGAGGSGASSGSGSGVLPANEPSFFEGIWNFLTNS